jgi:hypothetical protein
MEKAKHFHHVYDLLDIIIVKHLNIQDSINLLLVDKTSFNYTTSKRFYYIFNNKFLSYFYSLNHIKLKLVDSINTKDLYRILNNIYNYFKNHRDTSLADILIYLCDNCCNKLFEFDNIFNIIISHCFFSKSGNNIFNALKANDLIYLLQFYKNQSVILKYIFVPPEVLKYAIIYKSKNQNTIVNFKDNVKDINYMIKYMLFKHFFKYSEYIEDILTDIVCSLILLNNETSLQYLLKYYDIYKYKLNYQKILNACMQQSHINILDIIDTSMNKQNHFLKTTQNIDPQKIMIKKEYIRSLMQSKYYKVLNKIIDLYIGSTINMNHYFNEILPFYNESNIECQKLNIYFSIENKIRLKK